MTVLSVASAWDYHSSRFWVLFAAVSVFGLGALASFPWTSSYPSLIGPLSAGLGGGIAGALFWWVLIERPSKPTLLRGTLFGLLTVILAYPLMIIIGISFAELGIFISQPPDNIQLPVLDSILLLSGLYEFLTEFLWLVLVMVAISGIITLPVGITTGLVLVTLRQQVRNDRDI
jgi:hypothetical protein